MSWRVLHRAFLDDESTLILSVGAAAWLRPLRVSIAIGRSGSMADNAWLGREDSNLRMVESKSTALPLGDAPTAARQERLAPSRTSSATPVYRGS
jgi:hypothetical protein